MNINGVSPQVTASSILKNTSLPKDESASIDTKDSLVKANDQKELKKSDFLKLDESSKKGAIIGASVGGAVGALAGGITAYHMSMNKVKATNEFQSIELTYQTPVMRPEDLGRIPADYYQPNSWFSGGSHGFQSVIRDNPVMQNGKPVMQDVTKTYSDYGKPVVTQQNHRIEMKRLEGYSEYTRADVRYEDRLVGYDADGKAVYQTYEITNGWHHSFSPDIRSTTVGHYQTPKVKFETGVNVGLNTTLGVIAGAGLGAAAGALAGAAISHAANR